MIYKQPPGTEIHSHLKACCVSSVLHNRNRTTACFRLAESSANLQKKKKKKRKSWKGADRVCLEVHVVSWHWGVSLTCAVLLYHNHTQNDLLKIAQVLLWDERGHLVIYFYLGWRENQSYTHISATNYYLCCVKLRFPPVGILMSLIDSNCEVYSVGVSGSQCLEQVQPCHSTV